MKKTPLFILFILAIGFILTGIAYTQTRIIPHVTRFTDVPSDSPYAQAIGYVDEENIVDGYDDGTYRLEDTINRVEFTKIVVGSVFSLDEISRCDPSTLHYTDILSGEWYIPYLCIATQEGIIEGYSDNTFKPADEINVAEGGKIIAETLLDEVIQYHTSIWYRTYIENLANLNALPLELESPDTKITRGVMAEMIYRVRADITDRESHTYASLTANIDVEEHEHSEDTHIHESNNAGQFGNVVTITTDENYRYIMSNGLPDHETGEFPNSGNPNTISEQDYDFRMTLNPVYQSIATPVQVPGVSLNGVFFEPGTAEAWQNDMSSGWNYEALQDMLDLGLDF